MSFMASSFPFAASADLRILCQPAKGRKPASVWSVFRAADITLSALGVLPASARGGATEFSIAAAIGPIRLGKPVHQHVAATRVTAD
jgi:hypothetical protein